MVEGISSKSGNCLREDIPVKEKWQEHIENVQKRDDNTLTMYGEEATIVEARVRKVMK